MPKRGIAILCWSVSPLEERNSILGRNGETPPRGDGRQDLTRLALDSARERSMDARLDPVSMCGLEIGDAHIIR